MDFLQALKVVLVPCAVCNSPNAEIMHVRHHSPGVLEGELLLIEEPILECRHARVVGLLRQISQILHTRLKNAELIHFTNNYN